MNVSLNPQSVLVGPCEACDLKVRFWGTDGAKEGCVGCGLNHEVECDSALDLSSGETREVVMLVLREESEQNARQVSEN